jgi:luciferase-like monooxygenase
MSITLPESIVARVQSEVASWPGVTIEAYRGGMVFFHVGRREIGHLHGNRMADLPFPVRIREKLVAEGKADLHYLHPKTGWVTYYIRGEQDTSPIIELFRLNYTRPWLRPEQEGT